MSVISMKQLLEAGVHFGHQTRRWNPKMAPYIYTERNGIYIIDLQKSVGKVDEAYKAIADIAAEGGTILFVGTKKQAQDAIKTEAERCGMYYVNERWLGGMLTNFKTIQSRVERLKEIETMAEDGTFDVLPKKEVIALRKEWEKLERNLGGIKEMVILLEGRGAYSKLKFESGVHRVQRVPETESGGRIHTSTITVAVMPEVEEVDVVIDDKDIRIDVMRASGNGGQCVNTTDSAVRLTHYPTGIVVYSQTEKSQLQNKAKAFALLRAKLYDIEQQKAHDAEAELRRSQIGTGDRSEKIRTYNFPQGRVTDHRINLTLYKLDKIMNGDIQEILDACIAADQAAKLLRMGEN